MGRSLQCVSNCTKAWEKAGLIPFNQRPLMEMIVKRQKAAAFLEDRRPVDPSEFRLEKLVLPQPIIKSVEIKEDSHRGS